MDLERYTGAFLAAADNATKKKIVQEHVSRAFEGRESWNAWAAAFEKALTEIEGEFAELDSDYLISFERAHFPKEVDFAGFYFPVKVNFINNRFYQANFEDARFRREAIFTSVRFDGDTSFSKANFEGRALFDHTQFKGMAWFSGTTFHYEVTFDNAQFTGIAFFNEAHFVGPIKWTQAKFLRAKFHESAWFQKTVFGAHARFDAATFHGSVFFYETQFNRHSDFTGAQFGGVPHFDHALFTDLPEFAAVNFREPPSFAQVHIPYHRASTIFGRILGFPNKPSDVLAYRRLKGFAIAGHDHEQELYFFGHEQRAKRGVEVSGWSIIPGLLYDWFSDFGRSLVRPFVGFLLTFILAVGVQQHIYQSASKRRCALSPQAAYLTYVVSNSVPLLLQDRTTKQAINNCLFCHGIIPPATVAIGGIQSLLSAVFAFLFGLGLRNRFKIK